MVRRASAKEVFDLRTRCGELADKLTDRLTNGTDAELSQSSNYNARTNRCFADVGILSPGYTASKGAYRRYLYDVQDNRILASWERVNGEVSGSILDWVGHDRIDNPTPDQVAAFLNTVMSDRGDDQ
jgi:hypothetical protein